MPLNFKILIIFLYFLKEIYLNVKSYFHIFLHKIILLINIIFFIFFISSYFPLPFLLPFYPSLFHLHTFPHLPLSSVTFSLSNPNTYYLNLSFYSYCKHLLLSFHIFIYFILFNGMHNNLLKNKIL